MLIELLLVLLFQLICGITMILCWVRVQKHARFEKQVYVVVVAQAENFGTLLCEELEIGEGL